MHDSRGAGIAGLRTRSVLVVLFDGVQPLDVAGPVDVFSAAARFTGSASTPPYVVRTASLGGETVRSAGGLRLVPDFDLAEAEDPDLLLVPGGPGVEHVDARLTTWLRMRAPGLRRVMSVCTGAYLLAEAGLLDGRRATTHWDACANLASRFPQVSIDPSPIFVRDGSISTSAGVTAGVDLAIALVEEDFGRTVAHEIARLLVVYLRRPGNQAQLSVQLSAQIARSDPLREVQYWAAANLASDLSVPALAQRAGLSARQFARAFAEQVGTTPGRYVDLIRLESAQRMLTDTRDGVIGIAHRCGYGTPEAMRRAFMRELGVSPTEYRRRFASSSTIGS
ncbi:GlxA family transcriptional regulator [Micromonospora inyonensis]|uniref:Transcriptional regulator GlxA family, contains an amidase domain and an AraC-type DNA-binding HTH domain n=1 Tax=Micromonospora inyonensis TaxID=47866 RepID=A0A1C6S9Z7_9ACTN|nr:GlxA family transcriptional regulator [Micromonospora inyonensis]SCL26295.1 Transcriptional regulator GlxA family, contains an amidase domain and an AraC-type DNA-binding HTH domain [Micromonospora inyonensis]